MGEPVIGDRLSVPPYLINGSPSDHYVLRVVGDRFAAESIRDGDFLILQCVPEFASGDLVAVLVGDDTIIGRAFGEPDGQVRLGGNLRELGSWFAREDMKLLGVVVGLMRHYKRGGAT